MKLAETATILFIAFLIWQMHRHNLRTWQHYACLISLVFWISVLFLIGSNKVQSFDLAGNSVKLVDQKLEEIKALTEQNKLMAKATVELINHATTGLIAAESYDNKATYHSEVGLLRSAGFSDSEIKTIIEGAQSGAKTNSP